MSNPATYEDVNLILRLYELRREEKLRAAREWFLRSFTARTMEEFQALCPPGSEAHTSFRMVSSHWQMVASFITAGVLNEELFFKSGGELLFVWERLRHIVPGTRTTMKNPVAFQDLEAVATAFIRHMGPEAYDAFAQRVASMPVPRRA